MLLKDMPHHPACLGPHKPEGGLSEGEDPCWCDQSQPFDLKPATPPSLETLDCSKSFREQAEALGLVWEDPAEPARPTTAFGEPGIIPAEAAAEAREKGAVWEAPREAVERPSHYLLPGGREALLDVVGPVCDALVERGLSGFAVYAVGNALKYLCRAGAKGSAAEDLAKAREYLSRAIDRLQAEEQSR